MRARILMMDACDPATFNAAIEPGTCVGRQGGVLNQLSGNPDVAPECNQLEGGDFVPPGGTYQEEVGSEDTQLFECCIHPWMRTVVRTRGGG